ncbi:hypothetical protein GALMADRAFT_90357 [Galerina marginata CBS 339.88]|uniref:Uncharacterized protein n=1 Tax=Galerina marginata (strain CBS 339.88) TaxID=685588 RepID=A0A067TFD0_GALM3|nr:hypothetical protein GALMADRAFT_90357 [Galerina marginata CBS 339.88]
MAPTKLDKVRASALPILTKTAHFSAPFITTFLLIHLSAPALANIGGSSLSSRTMLLGREYYQTILSEPLLILGPLTLHAVSGSLKRLLSPPGRPPRRLTHLLSITGYATLLLFLPVHYLTHRAYPTLDVAPIYAVGPAELDYEFVKTGLKSWPIRSWLMYTGLVLSTTLHLVDGMTIIWNTYLKDFLPSWKLAKRPRRTALALGCIALPTLTGLYAISKEPMMTFASMASRYQAVFLSSMLYRI